jgi:succinate dehydrogenase/fumarate reductase cytochrome b subunit
MLKNGLSFPDLMDKFFRVMGSGQAYLNSIYLLFSFPLGLFYFVFLISGLSIGLSLLIIWVGVPILLLVGGAWWLLAAFERQMAIHWLKEDIAPMVKPPSEGVDLWNRFKDYFLNPVTWKGLLYLFLKFPLGIFSFVVLITLGSFTISFLAMPVLYQGFTAFAPQIDFGGGFIWYIDNMNDALLATLIGVFLWPVTLHAVNGVTWLHAKLAKYLLSMEWPGKSVAVSEEQAEA